MLGFFLLLLSKCPYWFTMAFFFLQFFYNTSNIIYFIFQNIVFYYLEMVFIALLHLLKRKYYRFWTKNVLVLIWCVCVFFFFVYKQFCFISNLVLITNSYSVFFVIENVWWRWRDWIFVFFFLWIQKNRKQNYTQ